MKLYRLLLISGATASLALVAPALGQTCTGSGCTVNNTASVTVGTVMRLTLSSTTTSLTAPNESAYDTGYQDDAGPTVTVKSNRPWNVQIKANAADWTASGTGARADKPAADLKWSRTDGSGYADLSTTSADVFASTQNATDDASQAIFYRTAWNWGDDTPGSYSLVTVYTLTAP